MVCLIFDVLVSTDYVLAQPVPVNDFHIYDINGSAWTKVAPSPTAPSPRVEFGFVAMDQMLYLFGGAYQYRGIFGAPFTALHYTV